MRNSAPVVLLAIRRLFDVSIFSLILIKTTRLAIQSRKLKFRRSVAFILLRDGGSIAVSPILSPISTSFIGAVYYMWDTGYSSSHSPGILKVILRSVLLVIGTIILVMGFVSNHSKWARPDNASTYLNYLSDESLMDRCSCDPYPLHTMVSIILP